MLQQSASKNLNVVGVLVGSLAHCSASKQRARIWERMSQRDTLVHLFAGGWVASVNVMSLEGSHYVTLSKSYSNLARSVHLPDKRSDYYDASLAIVWRLGDSTSCVPPDENFILRICGLAFDVLQCPCMGGSHRLRPCYHVSRMATVKDTHFAGLEWYRWCLTRCLYMY